MDKKEKKKHVIIEIYFMFMVYGSTENARHENARPSKMQVVKMRDMKMRHQSARVENARHESVFPTTDPPHTAVELP